jgi:hypothetical protein
MRRRLISCAALLLAVVLAIPSAPAAADTSVIATSDLEQALARRQVQDDAARDRVTTLLRRPDVQALAGEAGLDLKRAESAVQALDGAELEAVAAHAAALDQELAGGQTIRINLIVLLLIIIIVILLAD